MSEVITLSITIPDMLDPEDMHSMLSDLCAREVAQTVRTVERDREMEEVLESDEALAKWMGRGWYKRPPPYMRASSYKTVKFRQEMGDFWHSRFQSDPRRPVVMRGAVSMLQGKYSLKSGYCEDVVERYLRRIRFTSVDREEINDTIDSAFRRAMRLYEHHREYRTNGIVYIDGERKYLDEAELANVKKLQAMVQKVSKLETRIVKGVSHAT